jgi:hypothetical protein
LAATGDEQSWRQGTTLSGFVELQRQKRLSLRKDLTELRQELRECGGGFYCNRQAIRACCSPEWPGEFDVHDSRLAGAVHAVGI